MKLSLPFKRNMIVRCTMALFIIFSALSLSAQSQQYLRFDEETHIEVPEASKYIANASGVTMAGWFYAEDLAYTRGHLSFRSGGTGAGEMYFLQLDNGVLECRFRNSSDQLFQVVTSRFTVVPEQWQHFAWVYSNNRVELFLNGTSVGSTAASGVITSTDTPFAIGRSLSPFNFPSFVGGIDEVSLWSRGLTAAEIRDMMDNELVGDEAGLELYYKFNQGVPGGDNSSITSLRSEVEPGVRDGEFVGFELTGTTTNFLGTVDESVQAISFPAIPNKLVSDDPFELEATASSGLPVTYAVVSGPATIDGNTITLTGTAGEVVVSANQAGDSTFDPALEVVQSFEVLDPTTLLPETDVRAPLAGDFFASTLGPIQLAAITDIQFEELFSVDNISFQINGETITPEDHGNKHYTAWWTPPAYGGYTLTVAASNNFGNTSTQSVTFNVTDQASTSITANAGDKVWVYGNRQEVLVDVELPSHLAAYDQVIANLDVTCPDQGCDPWDRVVNIEVKDHTGEWYEVIRYITPYGIACTHTSDVTDFMSLLSGKVTMRYSMFTIETGFDFTLNLDYQSGVPDFPYTQVTKLWTGTYDFGNPANLTPTGTIDVSFPEEVEQASLKLVSTGHGWGDNNTNNAAEFSDNTHEIFVNGASTFEQNNYLDCNPNPSGCSNQNGTWFFDRAGWCPGDIAPWFDFNMTSFLDNGEVTLEYIFDRDYVDLCHPEQENCTSGVTCPNCDDGFNPHLIVSSFMITASNSPLDLETVSNTEAAPLVEANLFPNPSPGQVTIALNETVTNAEISLINSVGQVVEMRTLDGMASQVTMDWSAFPAGNYMVKIQSERGTELKKLVLSK